MPGSLSDLLSALDNPEGYIYNRVKRGELDAETRLRENLFASGYEGERQPSGITEPRGILGSIGESIGLLGPQQPRPLTPYERMLIDQGSAGRETSDLGLEGKRLNLSEAQKNATLNSLIRGGKAYGISGVESPEFVAGQPDLLNDYYGMIKTTKRDKAVEDASNRAVLKGQRLRNMYTMQGIKGERKNAAARAQELKDLDLVKSWESTAAAKQLSLQLLKFVGNPNDQMHREGELADLETETDPVKRTDILYRWAAFKKQLRQQMLAAKINPDLVEKRIQTLDSYGPAEDNPLSTFGSEANAPAAPGGGIDPKQEYMDYLNRYEQGLGE